MHLVCVLGLENTSLTCSIWSMFIFCTHLIHDVQLCRIRFCVSRVVPFYKMYWANLRYCRWNICVWSEFFWVWEHFVMSKNEHFSKALTQMRDITITALSNLRPISFHIMYKQISKDQKLCDNKTRIQFYWNQSLVIW